MSASIKPNQKKVLSSTLQDFFGELATGKYNDFFKPIKSDTEALKNPEKYVADFQAKVKKFREDIAKHPEGKEALKMLGYPTLH